MNKVPLIISLAGISFLRTHEKIKLLDKLDNLKELTLLSINDISTIVGRYIHTTQWNPTILEKQFEQVMTLIQTGSIQWCGYWDEQFPPLLRELYDPPFVLFWKGNLPHPEKPCVAVVGTRHATGRAMRAAYSLGKELAQAGIPVISGLARGIDNKAHQGALESSGVTIAVMACGVDRVYPHSSTHIASQMITCGGGLISEYLPGQEPLKWRFPQRNRLISGIARTIVVIEAPEKSGALITADYALEQGRDLCIHSVCMKSPVGDGGKRYVQDGAPIIENAMDINGIWEHNNISVTKYICEKQLSVSEQLAFDFEKELLCSRQGMKR